jgi:hypothetical protein
MAWVAHVFADGEREVRRRSEDVCHSRPVLVPIGVRGEVQCWRWVKRATSLAKIRVGWQVARVARHSVNRVEDGAGSGSGVLCAESVDELVRR